MGCKECGKPKCNGECGCKSPKVLQINNPAEYITFHKVSIPAAMGDSTTNPPRIGAYRNALVYYEADHTSWMYSTDGIPTLVTGEKGETGPQGPQGIQGPIGPAGADGESFTPVVVSSLPSTGTEGKLYLTPKAHTTQTATGNPITATVAEEAGQIESFKLDGDTSQQSYEGKNLLNYIDNLSSGGSGITNTLNPDGTITTQGKPTGNYLAVTNRYDITNSLEDGATYTLSSTSYSGKVFAQVRRTKISDGTTFNWDTIVQERSFTVDKGQYKYSVAIMTNTMTSWGDETLSFTQGYQLEKSASATSFEPFVGGQPSPNPDYPQPVQTVTGEQTVEIHGKNLLNFQRNSSSWNGASVTVEGTSITFTANSSGSAGIGFKTQTEPLSLASGNTIVFSRTWLNGDVWERGNFYINLVLNYSDGTSEKMQFSATTTSNYKREISISKTLEKDVVSIALSGSAYEINGLLEPITFGIQLEFGSTATSFAPYSKQTYTLNLGSIELCKLGGYQDYIWKDGEDWKVHKATAKAIFKDIEWKTARISNKDHYRQESISIKTEVLIPTSNAKFIGACSSYTVVTAGDTYGYPQKTGVAIQFSGYSTSGNICVYDPLYDAPNQADNFKAARANTEIYYALATPTDTTITDTTLIAQLEAIRTASLQNGANTITNTATGSNLAGDMEVGYYGYNPRNRYDEWLWLDINNEYEQIGS